MKIRHVKTDFQGVLDPSRGDGVQLPLGCIGVYCQEGYSLGGKVQRMGEMTVASLQAP